jgi:hypothetical protein
MALFEPHPVPGTCGFLLLGWAWSNQPDPRLFKLLPLRRAQRLPWESWSAACTASTSVLESEKLGFTGIISGKGQVRCSVNVYEFKKKSHLIINFLKNKKKGKLKKKKTKKTENPKTYLPANFDLLSKV